MARAWVFNNPNNKENIIKYNEDISPNTPLSEDNSPITIITEENIDNNNNTPSLTDPNQVN